MEPLDWHVAVYCANEERRLRRCLESVTTALHGTRSKVTVILNGTRDRSREIAVAASRSGSPVEVVAIQAGDKSNAINHFFHGLREPARAYGGVDAYSYVGPKSFRAMLDRLEGDPHPVAVSGVCTNGRTMKHATEATLKVGGKLHGQFHGFRGDFVDRLVARGIRLPIGTYWGDGLMGSMAAHNLDPAAESWNNARIVGVPEATYEIGELSVFNVGDIRRQAKRKIRQMIGRIQNAAIKDIIYRGGYESLPEYAHEMALAYVEAHGAPKAPLLDRPFQAQALRLLRQARRFESLALLPRRLGDPHASA